MPLLEVGFFHGDPHPGNLLKVSRCDVLSYVSCCVDVCVMSLMRGVNSMPLLEVGFCHGDPHPGNLLKVRRWMYLC
jgi:predicted unusual protein kinase regulating ubiquinone biosynthesis (AarF/ABC1/UbiB family)